MTREEAIEILQGAIKKPNTKDGYLGQAIDMAIQALEQEPSGDLISRQAVIDNSWELEYPDGTSERVVSLKEINALPPVNPQPKTGHWIKHNTGHSTYYDCSLCGCVAPCTETADNFIWKLSNFCPDCGARMIESKESEVEE